MNTTSNNGLGCFLMDVDLFQNIKIRKLIRRQGGKAVTVYVLLLCFIYKNGYYIGSDEDLPFIISEQTGYGEVYIQEVINSCLSLGLFDRGVYETHNVLTSEGIQERYMKAVSLFSKRKRKAEIGDYDVRIAEQRSDNGATSEQKLLPNGQKLLRKENEKENEKETPPFPTPLFSKEKEKEKEKERCFISPASACVYAQEEIPTKAISSLSTESPEVEAPPKPPRAVFTPPTVDEVREYVRMKGYAVDAERFWLFYESKGWMVGKNKMKKWHAAVATWQKTINERNNATASTNQQGGNRGESDADFIARVTRQVAASVPPHGCGNDGDEPLWGLAELP